MTSTMTTSSIRGWPPRPQRFSVPSSSPPPSPPTAVIDARRPSPPQRTGSSSPPHHDASPSRRPPPRHGDSTGSHESNLAIRARRGSSPRYNPRHISPPRLPAMPSAPRPSADQGIAPPAQAPPDEDDSLPPEPLQLSNITARAALRLLIETVQRHVREGDAVLDQSILLAAQQAKLAAETAERERQQTGGAASPDDPHRSPGPASPGSHLHDDIPRSHKTPIGSPETQPADRITHTPPPPAASPPPLELDESARDMQRRILARKFVSRVAPPIAPAEYLERLHRYCPMSTAVYLTAGLYIERLARGGRRKRSNIENDPLDDSTADDGADTDTEPILPINSRTVHRLVLGALRIATKALEDLSYPHTRFAKVGGVSDKELTRLEVAILFLAEFKLIVSPDVMLRVAQTMRARALDDIKEESE